MLPQTTLALVLFLFTYILLITLPNHRCPVALGAAACFIALGLLPWQAALPAIDWNVLLMLAGTMGLVSLFIASRMPSRMADLLLRCCPNVRMLAVVLSLFAGLISAFVDNVATELMVAPVALALCRKLDISPVALLISISVSSNLQGAATLVGDTTSILLGSYAGMNFLDFFFTQGRPGIFWAVELGAAATVPVILFLFRHERAPVTPTQLTEVRDLGPTVLLVGMVVLLIAASFLPQKPALTNGLICSGLCLAGTVRAALRGGGRQVVRTTLREIDFTTLGLLAGLFLVIEGITRAGVIDLFSTLFVKVGGGDLFLTYTLIVWGSVLISAFVDNIPYVATMLPVVTGIAQHLGIAPTLFYFGLLTGATLGGNLTPIGASASIATIGILRRNGYTVRTGDFLRIGIPFTLAAVMTGYLFCWLVWA